MEELQQSVFTALQTYSNVHRGSGQFSQITTHLYERAREIIMELSGLPRSKYRVIFATGHTAQSILVSLNEKDYIRFASDDLGLAIGVNALVIKKSALKVLRPVFTGGGTARLMSPAWVVWSGVPEKFEAGTPAIINIITLVKALLLSRKYGQDIFKPSNEKFPDGISEKKSRFSDATQMQHFKNSFINTRIKVPTLHGFREFTYLDNAASTPALLDAWYAYREHINPLPDKKIMILDEVSKIAAQFLNAPLNEYETIFTSNTTEAINLIAHGLENSNDDAFTPVVLGSIMEHSSNDLPWRTQKGAEFMRFTCDNHGFPDLEHLESLLKSYNKENDHGNKRVVLVSITAASNVLGNYTNLKQISLLVHKYGARLLVDAAQMVAHREIDMKALGIDYLAFSAHKMYAPFGAGVLVSKMDALPFSEDELQSIRTRGEANVAGIAAMGQAMNILMAIGWDIIQKEEEKLTVDLIKELSTIPEIEMYGPIEPDCPEFANKGGVVAFGLNKMMADRVAKNLAASGAIGVRYGCHCAHIFVKKILNIGPGLERFQRLIVSLLPSVQLPGVTRISLSLVNNPEDIKVFVSELKNIISAAYRKERNNKSNEETTSKKSDYKREMEKFLSEIETAVYN
jgi:selenocysteine lyase/cysteine desulfurase